MSSNANPTGTIFDRYERPIYPNERRRTYAGNGDWARETTSGSEISDDNILEIDTIFACIRVLAESEACLPLDMMVDDGTNKKATDHPLYNLIRWQPNDEMTAYDLRMWMMVDCILRGRGVAQVQRNKRGAIVAIWPLLARRLRAVRRSNGKMYYLYSQGEPQKPKRVRGAAENEVLLEFNEVLHIPFFYHGGLLGQSLSQLQREHLGSAKAMDDYSNDFFKNGGVVSGVLSTPQELSEAAYERMKADWKNNHTKKGDRFGVPILEGGTKFESLAPKNSETQLLESKKYRRSTLSGIMRVPGHMIGDLEKATFSNIEHQDLGFVKHTMRPWMTNWEQRCQMTLLNQQEINRFYFKHNTRDLLRGDLKSRAEAASSWIQAGIASPNEIREIEDMPPYAGGEKHLVNGSLRDINNEPDYSEETSTTKSKTSTKAKK